jgi:hypothetical protein
VIDLLGWIGSAILVASLLQGTMMRLRVLNLVAAVMLVAYNIVVETWPMVGMNLAVALIDIWFIVGLAQRRPRHPASIDSVPHGTSPV